MDDNKQLFIPDKIKVGFQKRDGTYTGKLAYVIYYDLKNVLRKEKSWQSWRDHKIAAQDIDNTPMEGFVLNKGVGGQRQSYGWNARNEYIRVYDPRDFEFEISVANLLFILRECDCSRGKGLEGKFVYAWDGTELVLLPERSSDYQNSKKYTTLQAQGVKAKELIPGASYETKKQEILVYLGRFDYFSFSGNYYSSKGGKSSHCKKYVFWKDKDFVFLNDLKSIAILHSDTVVSNFAELVTKYSKSENGSKIVKIFTKSYAPKAPDPNNYWRGDYWVTENADGSFTEWVTHMNYNTPGQLDYIQSQHDITFKNGVVLFTSNHGTAYPPGKEPKKSSYSGWYGRQEEKYKTWVTPTNLHLYAELESGKQIRISQGGFHHRGDY